MEFGRIVITDDILKIKNKEKALSDKIKEFKKLYNEILQLQHIINHYGCNMMFLSECVGIYWITEQIPEAKKYVLDGKIQEKVPIR